MWCVCVPRHCSIKNTFAFVLIKIHLFLNHFRLTRRWHFLEEHIRRWVYLINFYIFVRPRLICGRMFGIWKQKNLLSSYMRYHIMKHNLILYLILILSSFLFNLKMKPKEKKVNANRKQIIIMKKFGIFSTIILPLLRLTMSGFVFFRFFISIVGLRKFINFLWISVVLNVTRIHCKVKTIRIN